MSYELLNDFINQSHIVLELASCLKEGAVIKVIFTDDQSNCFIKKGPNKLICLNKETSDFDLCFYLSNESLEEITSMDSNDIADYGIKVFENVRKKKMNVKFNISFLELTTKGYLAVLKLGGKSMLRYLARFGLLNFMKLKKAITNRTTGGN
ncbi:MAG: hypothetical protein ABIA04_03975 [Pseudomonadota bacterium]